MSGYNDNCLCPICGKEMSTYNDYKPFDNVSGECLHCGFCYYTKCSHIDINELNIMRSENDIEPISLKKYKKFGKDIKNL